MLTYEIQIKKKNDPVYVDEAEMMEILFEDD